MLESQLVVFVLCKCSCTANNIPNLSPVDLLADFKSIFINIVAVVNVLISDLV